MILYQCISFSHSLFQIAYQHAKKSLPKSVVDTNSKDFDIGPIVTAQTEKAIKNLMTPVVLNSLFNTHLHTEEYKAGIISR